MPVLVRIISGGRFGHKDLGSSIVTIGFFVLKLVIFFVLLNFTRFHLGLVTANETTIETLEKQRSNGPIASFSMGAKDNWIQVFGKNWLLWPFPVFGDSGKPVGDGVIWPKPAQTEEEGALAKSTREDVEGNN